jgi:hypothetical protein
MKAHPQLHPLNKPLRIFGAESPLPPFSNRMHRLIVDPSRSIRSRTTESIDRDPSEDLVVRPGLHVAPVVQFLVDPDEEAVGLEWRA